MPLLWQFFQDKWDTLWDRYATHPILLGSIIKGVTDSFATFEKATEFEGNKAHPLSILIFLSFLTEFWKGKPVSGIERVIKQISERIRTRASWLARDGEQVHQWLVQNAHKWTC